MAAHVRAQVIASWRGRLVSSSSSSSRVCSCGVGTTDATRWKVSCYPQFHTRTTQLGIGTVSPPTVQCLPESMPQWLSPSQPIAGRIRDGARCGASATSIFLLQILSQSIEHNFIFFPCLNPAAWTSGRRRRRTGEATAAACRRLGGPPWQRRTTCQRRQVPSGRKPKPSRARQNGGGEAARARRRR
jgi:hypothetical protein